MPNVFKGDSFFKIFKRIPFSSLKEEMKKKKTIDYNKFVLKEIKRYKPDFLFTQNCGGLLPDTVKTIQALGIKTITTVVDSPYNNIRSTFAVSLRYFNLIINTEDTWMHVLNNLAPRSKIIKFYGGYDPNYFFPAEKDSISEREKSFFENDIIFTGGSYGGIPEGAFRAGIIGQLLEDNYSVSIWGDKGWKLWEIYYPEIKKVYKGERLSYENLRKMVYFSKIYLNMPSPQVATSFQPRVFEVAACKGFQMIHYSKDLSEIFEIDKIATFRTYNELKEKINFFLRNPEERSKIIEYMYNTIKNEYTFNKQVERIAMEIERL